MYPEIMVIPMREELTRLGIEELRTAEAVDSALSGQSGTAMVIVNSICGCAAGRRSPRRALLAGRSCRGSGAGPGCGRSRCGATARAGT